MSPTCRVDVVCEPLTAVYPNHMPVIPLRPRPRVLEFFAGVGLARIGLDNAGFETAWANDISPDKAAMYRAQFDDDVMEVGDVNDVDVAGLPAADLAWASSPCTDLSLAGNRTGLAGADLYTVEFIGNRSRTIPVAHVLGSIDALACAILQPH